MSNPNPARIAGGIPAGGQYARNGQVESAETLDGSTETPVSRFATTAARRATPVPQYMESAQPYKNELRQAMTYLRDFKPGDTVVVASEQGGKEHFATITSDRLSDGSYGSAESRTLGASLGVNKYTFDVDAHKLAVGKVGLRHARPDEQADADAQFAAAAAAWVIAKQDHIDQANTRLAAANLPAVGEPAVAWEGTTSELHGTVHDMTERGSVGFVIDGRPGSSLVPVDAVSPKKS